eukprot:SAG11_NODE_387_length_9883_cov_9.365699_9_plen_310_part_00
MDTIVDTAAPAVAPCPEALAGAAASDPGYSSFETTWWPDSPLCQNEKSFTGLTEDSRAATLADWTSYAYGLFGSDALPQTGLHYFEVEFSLTGDGGGFYEGLESLAFVGVVTARTNDYSLSKKRGVAWGFRDDPDRDCLRVGGRGKGAVPLNPAGRSYAAGERVGVAVDMDACSLQLFRDGEPVPGAVVGGYDKSAGVWIAASWPGGRTATLSFPGGPAPAPGLGATMLATALAAQGGDSADAAAGGAAAAAAAAAASAGGQVEEEGMELPEFVKLRKPKNFSSGFYSGLGAVAAPHAFSSALEPPPTL